MKKTIFYLLFAIMSLNLDAQNLFKVENNWSNEWHDGGVWKIGSRVNQPIIEIDIISNDNGQTLEGSITYLNEGPIGFRATMTTPNYYNVEYEWSGEWHEAEGYWMIGNRNNQNVIELKAQSTDDGKTLIGEMKYDNEGSIGFKAKKI